MALSLGNNKYTLANFRGDIIGGITTVVIVYPAALAFGVASGLGPIAGLYCVVAVAFFAAAFGGTPAMYSGPTAPMTVAMAVIVSTSSHNLTEAFATVCLAGIFQIIFGVMRLGRFIAYTPHSVISGYMTGIGVIVISINILPLMGLTKVTTDSIAQISSIPIMLTMNQFGGIMRWVNHSWCSSLLASENSENYSIYSCRTGHWNIIGVLLF